MNLMTLLFNRIQSLSSIDLGSTILSIAIALGFFLLAATIFRSIEIPIRIYLNKRNKLQDIGELLSHNNENKKGF